MPSPEPLGAAAAAVGDALRGTPASTISHLAESTGLSRPSVRTALDALVEAGLAEAADIDSATAGRPAATYRLRASSRAVLALSIMGSRLGMALAGLDGEITRASSTQLDPTESREGRFETVVGAITSFLDGQVPDLVSAGVTGVIDEGVITRSEVVPQWAGFPIAERLATRLSCPVITGNDVNLAALAESALIEGTPESMAMLYAEIGQAVNTGLVIDHQIRTGPGSNAGEMADFLGLQLNVHSDAPDDRVRTARIALALGAACAVIRPDHLVLSAASSAEQQQVSAVRHELGRLHRHGAPSLQVDEAQLGEEAALVGAAVLGADHLARTTLGTDRVRRAAPTGLVLARAAFPSSAHRGGSASPRRTLRVAVIGAGARSSLALHCERDENGAELVLACDPHPLAAERVRSQLGRDIELVQSIDEVIAHRVDCAFVTSPDDTHAEIAVALLEAGIHVYLEKPMAITTADATRILEAAHRSRARLYVGHNMRHMAVVRSLRDIVTGGIIGQTKAIWCRHFVGSGGDFYFKDWHAERSRTNSLLLQKGAHDIDVMHWLGGSFTREVVGMGALTLYDQIEDRRDRSEQLLGEFYSLDNWPPLSQRGLNPTIDVEDLSMVMMRFNNDVFASYTQCHYTPDYWRNYTIIGTEGRVENFGDGEGGQVKVWTRRTTYSAEADLTIPIVGDARGHDDADVKTVAEFFRFVRGQVNIDANPLNAWRAVAATAAATESLRAGSMPVGVPTPPQYLVDYFAENQPLT